MADDRPATGTGQRTPSLEFSIGSFRFRTERALSILAALAGIVTAGAAAFLSGPAKVDSQSTKLLTALEERLIIQRAAVEAQTAAVEKDIEALRAEMRKLTAVPTDSKLASQLERTEGGIKDVAGRLGKLEAVILNDPGKSLEMPLLRNELDHIKKGYQSDLLTLKEEIGRIYDLTKWFIGLMFTMALGVIGLAVTNFVKAGASRAS